MIREIVLYGDPVLRRKASWVRNIDGEIKKLIKDLRNTIKAEGGVGLASNQIGVLKRVIVLHEMEEEGEGERGGRGGGTPCHIFAKSCYCQMLLP